MGVNDLIRRFIPEEKKRKILKHHNDLEYGDHFSGDRTLAKVL